MLLRKRPEVILGSVCGVCSDLVASLISNRSSVPRRAAFAVRIERVRIIARGRPPEWTQRYHATSLPPPLRASPLGIVQRCLVYQDTSGPFTVFSPTNAAFAKQPPSTVESLLRPEMKAKLTGVLTYHVVPGRLSAKDLMEAARKNGGTAEFKTVEGETISVESNGNMLVIRDAKGNASKVTIQNVFQSNSVIHVIDAVLLPSYFNGRIRAQPSWPGPRPRASAKARRAFPSDLEERERVGHRGDRT